MIDNETIYGVEFYSQDNNRPGFVLTFTGAEIKKLIKFVKKDLEKETSERLLDSKI